MQDNDGYISFCYTIGCIYVCHNDFYVAIDFAAKNTRMTKFEVLIHKGVRCFEQKVRKPRANLGLTPTCTLHGHQALTHTLQNRHTYLAWPPSTHTYLARPPHIHTYLAKPSHITHTYLAWPPITHTYLAWSPHTHTYLAKPSHIPRMAAKYSHIPRMAANHSHIPRMVTTHSLFDTSHFTHDTSHFTIHT